MNKIPLTGALNLDTGNFDNENDNNLFDFGNSDASPTSNNSKDYLSGWTTSNQFPTAPQNQMYSETTLKLISYKEDYSKPYKPKNKFLSFPENLRQQANFPRNNLTKFQITNKTGDFTNKTGDNNKIKLDRKFPEVLEGYILSKGEGEITKDNNNHTNIDYVKRKSPNTQYVKRKHNSCLANEQDFGANPNGIRYYEVNNCLINEVTPIKPKEAWDSCCQVSSTFGKKDKSGLEKCQNEFQKKNHDLNSETPQIIKKNYYKNIVPSHVEYRKKTEELKTKLLSKMLNEPRDLKNPDQQKINLASTNPNCIDNNTQTQSFRKIYIQEGIFFILFLNKNFR